MRKNAVERDLPLARFYYYDGNEPKHLNAPEYPDELYRKMDALITEDCSSIFLMHPLAYGLFQPWLKNYKYHDRPYSNVKYYRVDPAMMKH